MDPLVIAALISAAILHASWHALIKANRNQIIAIGGMNVATTSVCALLLFTASPLSPWAMGIIALSVLIHFAYKVALAHLYQNTHLSLAYPLARGLCPVLAVMIAFFALGEKPGMIALLGILFVCAGVYFLVTDGLKKQVTTFVFLLAGFAAATVALYSVLDAYGVRFTESVFSFTVHLVFWDGLVFIAYALWATQGKALKIWAIEWKNTALTGILGLTSFGIFIWSLSKASVGGVSAIRETSIIFSVLISALILKERITAVRWIGVSTITIGVMLLAVGKFTNE
ncbi:DMT family transporter [Polynucleobacter sp. AP-Latsch-80-C2]|uniref:DMT family transporter n=1 Tax=Polynucleobacter sp. AP-Latsch-80-C2 TaxID=2576931 RepID=UPI001C0D3DDE|nr:DMT family transporter [Polynucleobacter sp. AP-Latsch-80-C2]MBU3624414.1 EamA family transporter [Polynucleobacter sp. AP-Latsch-80-C2]